VSKLPDKIAKINAMNIPHSENGSAIADIASLAYERISNLSADDLSKVPESTVLLAGLSTLSPAALKRYSEALDELEDSDDD